jgi:hypothetical protein
MYRLLEIAAMDRRKDKNSYRKKGYDAPRDGFKRWTTYVRIDLFQDFKRVANAREVSLIDAINEAMKDWRDKK